MTWYSCQPGIIQSLRLSRQPFGLMLWFYINNIQSDLFHSGFYRLMSFAHGGPSLGVIYILDRLTLTGNNLIFSITDAVSTQRFATEDENISANIMTINKYPISLCILVNLNFYKTSTTTYSV
jgi:hypothetical protein